MKCLNIFLLLIQKCFPDPVNDSFKDGKGIPSVLLLFITKCIFLDRIQYHVSRFEHQKHAVYPWLDSLRGIKKL